MKKFVLPEINAVELVVEDVILASDNFANPGDIDQEIVVPNPSTGDTDWV